MKISKPSDYQQCWNQFIRDILNVRLDKQQQEIVDSVRVNRRTTVRSGHARGKDFVAACISIAFHYLYYPSTVIMSAPTGRQVNKIMLAEVKSILKNAKIPMGGTVMADGIKHAGEEKWYLVGFKAADKSTESWTGFHNQYVLVVFTEGSGIHQETYDAVDGVLTGKMTRFLCVGNPNNTTGEFHKSFKSPIYQGKFILNCLDAENVVQKKIVIPGQVDWEWVNEKVIKWAVEIEEKEVSKDMHDFKWENKWYRPNNLFLPRVIGEFPREGEDQLVPLSWLEAARRRWDDAKRPDVPLRLGVDVAGMGRDVTVFMPRYKDYVDIPEASIKSDHMETAGKTKAKLKTKKDKSFIDTIGEGAGVHSRLIEQEVKSVSVKFSEGVKHLSDITGELEFGNMRAYCYWAVRDALDPKHDAILALPPCDELIEELAETKWKVKSNGKIFIEEKDEIKKRLKRSPDYADALANTYYPDRSDDWSTAVVSNVRDMKTRGVL